MSFELGREMIGIRRTATALAAVMTCTLLPACSAEEASVVSGTIECTNGREILGIWVEAADPAKRGWAGDRHSTNGETHINTWQYPPVHTGDSYAIHVGCGTWEPKMISENTGNHSGNFKCKPVEEEVRNRCWDA